MQIVTSSNYCDLLTQLFHIHTLNLKGDLYLQKISHCLITATRQKYLRLIMIFLLPYRENMVIKRTWNPRNSSLYIRSAFNVLFWLCDWSLWTLICFLNKWNWFLFYLNIWLSHFLCILNNKTSAVTTKPWFIQMLESTLYFLGDHWQSKKHAWNVEWN